MISCLAHIHFRQITPQTDGELDAQVIAAFYRSMHANMALTYIKGRQITFTERMSVRSPKGNLEATMSAAVEAMRKKLFHIWPRAKELRYVVNMIYFTVS